MRLYKTDICQFFGIYYFLSKKLSDKYIKKYISSLLIEKNGVPFIYI